MNRKVKNDDKYPGFDSPELVLDAPQEPDSFPREEALLEIELAAENKDFEENSPESPVEDNQEVEEDPIRLYLHEIGRVPLLSAKDEKITARRIELGKRVSVIRQRLEIDGSQVSASRIFQEIIKDLGLSWEIIRQLRENVGLPRRPVSNKQLPLKNSGRLSMA